MSELLPVGIADAVAELAVPTLDEDVDAVHGALIDLIQQGLVHVSRGTEDGKLRYGITQTGLSRVTELLGP